MENNKSQYQNSMDVRVSDIQPTPYCTKAKLISIQVTILPYQQIISQLIKMVDNGSSYICLANVHMMVEAHNNADFASIVNNADIVAADGMPILRGLKLLYGIGQERIAGMDLLPDLLKKAEQELVPVFFYGGAEAMVTVTQNYLQKKYPLLQVAGVYSPPFRKLSYLEEEAVIDMINASGAKLVFVCLGCPKQEKWMGIMKGKINACMIGIGGALPVLVGIQKRAPAWMIRIELEWLFRLLQEPRRLFKRYAVTNSKFILLIMTAWAKQGFKKQQLQ